MVILLFQRFALRYAPHVMPKLTADDVRHIAKLARLTLSDQEVTRFTTELSAILDFVEQLQKVDTKNVKPLKNVTGLRNGLREDKIKTDGPTPEGLLECSPLPIIDRQIETPSAHG